MYFFIVKVEGEGGCEGERERERGDKRFFFYFKKINK
jgi:hypothetical protein